MKKSIVSLVTGYPVFTGNRPEVWDAARHCEGAYGQTVCYGGDFAVIVADDYGVIGVFTTPAAMFSALAAARTENALIRAGLAR